MAQCGNLQLVRGGKLLLAGGGGNLLLVNQDCPSSAALTSYPSWSSIDDTGYSVCRLHPVQQLSDSCFRAVVELDLRYVDAYILAKGTPVCLPQPGGSLQLKDGLKITQHFDTLLLATDWQQQLAAEIELLLIQARIDFDIEHPGELDQLMADLL